MSYELKSAKELTEIAKRTTDYNTLHQMLCYACDKRKSLDARGKAYRANLWNKAHDEIEARFIALFPPDDVVESPIIKPAPIVKPKAKIQSRKPEKPVMSAKILAGIVESYLMQRANAGMEYAEFKIGNAKFRIGTAEQAIKNYIKGLKKIKAQHIGEFSPV
jgi:hypothetical protein